MKVLFLHLSDMHFVSDSSYTKKDCEEIANAVAAKIICPISMIFLVLSGDIAFSGGAEEYNEAEKFVGELQASILGKVEIDKEKIKVLLVPGNHDRQYCSMSLTIFKTGQQVFKQTETFLVKSLRLQ